MITIARQAMNQNDGDNTTLEARNLKCWAIQRDQDWENEKTAWIFTDGSALIESAQNDWEVIDNYGLSCDHEQL